MNVRASMLCLANLVVLAPVVAVGANYTFTSAVDSSGPILGFATGASINSQGVLAFRAPLDAGGQGIFRVSEGITTTIADTSGPFSSFDGIVAIDSSGVVAFRAILDDGSQGIFIGSGGPTATIIDSSSPFAAFGAPAVNAAGTVAFRALRDGGAGDGVFTSNGGPVTTIADSSGELGNFGDGVAINDAGVVAFRATRDADFGGIFVGSGGPIATIADVSGRFSTFFDRVSINDGGLVAFQAALDAGGREMAVGNGGPATTIATTTGAFRDFANQWINASGTVVFSALTDTQTGAGGLYTGNDPTTDAVIEIGDPLFGSTLVARGFSRGLNNRGDVAFAYLLANDVSGIAVATVVPEPASMMLGVATMAWLGRRRSSGGRAPLRRTFESRLMDGVWMLRCRTDGRQ